MDETTWQDRLVTEFHELNARIKKLLSFVATPEFRALDGKSKGLLVQQLHAMNAYYQILADRLDHAGVEFKPAA